MKQISTIEKNDPEDLFIDRKKKYLEQYHKSICYGGLYVNKPPKQENDYGLMKIKYKYYN